MSQLLSFNHKSARAGLATGLLCLVSGCMSLPMGGSVGPNPLSIGLTVANHALATQVGKSQAATITPQEEARFAALSCPDLVEQLNRYETAETMAQDPTMKAKNGNSVAQTAIATRINYLKTMTATRGCA